MNAAIATPDDIRAAAKRKIGVVLKSLVAGTTDQLFPIPIRARLSPQSQSKPSLESYAAATKTLVAQSKSELGKGYTLHLERRRSREYGEQDFPVRVTVDSLEDFQFLTDCAAQCRETMTVCQRVRETFPALESWLVQNAVRLNKFHEPLNDLLIVAKRFVDNPLPDCYLRELDVPVDTKFIDRSQTVLKQWLDILLPPSAIDVNETKFARRYGLRDGEQHLLIRILEPNIVQELRFPCEEFSLPLRSLAKIEVYRWRVLIVENRTTLLTLPPLPDTVAIGGLGDSVTRFRKLAWLERCELFYWGDLDVDGLRILGNLRQLFPNVQSILMDRKTLDDHADQVRQGNGRQYDETPTLTQSENELLADLGANNWRLEQEKIATTYSTKVIEAALSKLSDPMDLWQRKAYQLSREKARRDAIWRESS